MSAKPMEGLRVIEVAAWTFVPAAGAVLADWGADVIKIENPVGGDPQRNLAAGGIIPASSVNFIIEVPNRGKRSVGIDLTSDEGRELLYELVRGADVFLTNFLPSTRQRLKIDVEDIRAVNPKIIYARGSGHGPNGPDAGDGGYDATSYWARTGVAAVISQGDEFPRSQPMAFGDVAGAQTIAGGIAAALFARERTGEGSVVDVSLLGYGLWNVGPSIVACELLGIPNMPSRPREQAPNPIVGSFKTSDGRFVQLVMLQSDRYWGRLCEVLDRPDLAADPRFTDAGSRAAHAPACIAELDAEFAKRTLADVKTLLNLQEGPWAVHQLPIEVFDDPQIAANGYLQPVIAGDGSTFHLVANPVQFDEVAPTLTRAPEHGEHTEEVLLEAGHTWDDLIDWKKKQVIS
jgi:crotonobetainyl-CoA:carnitine CoA-transferase CaiB-like acyl-CoA transferase